MKRLASSSVTFTEVDCAETLSVFQGVLGCTPLAPETFACLPPDLHLMRFNNSAGLIDWLTARCSLWWSRAPSHEGERLGLIGHYEAESEAAGRELLQEALQQLQKAGCTRAAGPMDGATWRPYRFVLPTDEERRMPPFFMEPRHPADYPQHFRRAGFVPWMYYRSARVPLPAESERAAVDGRWSLRPLRMEHFEEELGLLHRLATASFAGSFLYTPLPKALFLKQYRPLRSILDPDLVRIAEHEGKPIGFCFAFPNSRPSAHGATRATASAVLKTLAVHPAARGQGLGTHLVADVHRQAHAKGYRQIIHALMRDGNPSNRISDDFPGAHTLRRYALFAKTL